MAFFDAIRSGLSPDLAHVIDLQRRLKEMLRGARCDEIAGFLDELDHSARLAAVRSLGGGDQRRLFEVVGGFQALTIDGLVPPGIGRRVTVRHYGKNSLPAFNYFEKRMLRPEGEDLLWGYNHQRWSTVTGPGYFVARDAPERGEVDLDYTVVPPERPPGWPEVQVNDRGFSHVVYARMVDRVRKVSRHVSVSRAFKRGRAQPMYFVLCRE